LNTANFLSRTKLTAAICVITGLILLIILLFITGSCSSSSQTTGVAYNQPSGLSAEEIRQKVLENSTAVHSYVFAMAMNMRISLPEENYIDQQSNIHGNLDKLSQKMHLSLALSQRIEAGRTKKTSANSDIYVSGKEMWVKTSGLGSSGGWQDKPVPDNFWSNQDIITQQTRLLAGAELKLNGTAEVNNTDCYVLDIKPDLKALWETLQQQGDLESLAGNANPEEMIRDVSIQVWIDKKVFLPLRVKEDMTLLADLSNLSVPDAASGDVSDLKINIELTVSDYNTDVPVEAPPELANKY
jgi:hypothetical protein